MRHLHNFLHLAEGLIYIAATLLVLAGWEAAWACHFLLGLAHLVASAEREGVGAAARRAWAKAMAWMAGIRRP